MTVNDKGQTVYRGQEAMEHFLHGLAVRRVLREARKLHYKTTFQDIPISVENRKGSVRRGTDPDGDEWKTKMKVPYGYIPGTKGVDGDELDVFVGPDENAAFAYIVHCNKPDGKKFDEDKVMLGFKSKDQAKRCFCNHYDDPLFFGGIDAIPMWKFNKKIWIKKHTTQKLVASRGIRENSGDGSLNEILRGKEHKTFGMTGTDLDTRRAILGHHQDIMINPTVREGRRRRGREHGTRGMKWGIRTPKEVVLHVVGSKNYVGEMDHPTKGKVHIFHDPAYNDPKSARTLTMYEKDIEDPKSVRDHIHRSRDIYDKQQKQEAREHGVRGQKWGVRNKKPTTQGRRSVAGQTKPQKSRATKPADLLHDPRTLNAMQVVKRSQSQLNAIAHRSKIDDQQRQQQGKPPKSVEEHHKIALEALKELGWKVIEAGAKLTGTEGLLAGVRSVLKSVDGHKAKLETDSKGNHKLTPSKSEVARSKQTGQRQAALKSRAQGTGGKLGIHKRESNRFREGRIYYARPFQRYGTKREARDLDSIREAFPGDRITIPRNCKKGSSGMAPYHARVEEADSVVISRVRKDRVTAGVASEAQHALKNGIPVRMLKHGKLFEVDSLDYSGGRGRFARVRLKKKNK